MTGQIERPEFIYPGTTARQPINAASQASFVLSLHDTSICLHWITYACVDGRCEGFVVRYKREGGRERKGGTSEIFIFADLYNTGVLQQLYQIPEKFKYFKKLQLKFCLVMPGRTGRNSAFRIRIQHV